MAVKTRDDRPLSETDIVEASMGNALGQKAEGRGHKAEDSTKVKPLLFRQLPTSRSPAVEVVMNNLIIYEGQYSPSGTLVQAYSLRRQDL